MCLVSYVPLSKDRFVLTSNRDEAPERAAADIIFDELGGQQVVYPRDTKGGSWYFCSTKGIVVCLLNGAFVLHQRKLPYRMSRGKMLKSFFEYANAVDFIARFDFWNIEPFTAVLAHLGYVLEFRWDGSVKHVRKLDPSRAHIWSSSTLYSDESIQRRHELFHQLLEERGDKTPENVLNVHRTDGLLPVEESFVMNRSNVVQTISITQSVIGDKHIYFSHEDLIIPERSSKTVLDRA